jgi:hypothetical protein
VNSKAQRLGTSFFAAFFALLMPAFQAAAQDNAPAAPVAIADAKNQTGAFKVTLSRRSPFSDLKEIAKRASIKPDDLGADYELANETFYVYVPKSPAEDGKYGVMVGLCFKEYGFPAIAWPDVLEKKHLIWIGAMNNGDSRPAAQRIGLLLDAAFNIQANWPIDPDRVYLSMNAVTGTALGTALYYPDVFTGYIGSPYAYWYTKLKGFESPPWIWDTDQFPRPAAKQMTLARANLRVFQANRDDGNANRLTQNKIILKKGFGSAGFHYVKFVNVPEANMGHYVNYTADWFEQGIDFLDQPLPKIRAARQPRPKSKLNPLLPIGSN